MKKDYSIIVGGAAGQGSRKAGLIIAKILKKLGYFVYIYDDYQSLIKGGHNFSQIRISDHYIASRKNKIDLLIAFDKKTIDLHESSLDAGGGLIFNKNKTPSEIGIGIEADAIVKKYQGKPIMANTAMIGGFLKVTGIDWNVAKIILEKEFGDKENINMKIAKEAYDSIKGLIKIEPNKKTKNPEYLMTGNEATALGATKAGLDIYFAYPMTPASGILHYFADHEEDLRVLPLQIENEIAVANEAIGAAYAGKRTMVASSSGGFALMSEAICLSVISETPVLFINSQRMGPATGVPTYSGQSDLLFSINPGPGDFEKFVAAPANSEEAAIWSGKLLNLAWQYQTPSILLLDKELSEGTFSVRKNIFKDIKKEKEILWNKKGEYGRYKITQEGISPLAYPGLKATIKASSYEHDEKGLTVEENEGIITAMQEKRLRKFKLMERAIDTEDAINIFGNKKAKTAVISWGFTSGVVQEVSEKMKLKFIQPIVVSPFPIGQMTKALKGVEEIILVENNALGQLGIVMARYGIYADKKILKYTSRPFSVEELEDRIGKAIKA